MFYAYLIIIAFILYFLYRQVERRYKENLEKYNKNVAEWIHFIDVTFYFICMILPVTIKFDFWILIGVIFGLSISTSIIESMIIISYNKKNPNKDESNDNHEM